MPLGIEVVNKCPHAEGKSTATFYLSQTHKCSRRGPSFRSELKSGVLNVLSLPGGRIRNCYDFSPREKNYSVIILFIGANDCFYKGGVISDRSAKDIAEDLRDLASVLSDRAETYVLGLPQRHDQPNRTKDVNKLLLELIKSSVRKFKGVGHYLGKKDVSSGDEIHLTEDGLKNLKRLMKTEILKKKFSLVKDKEETQLITCDEKNPKCICGSYKPY